MAEVKEKVWVWTYEAEGMLRRMIKAGESTSVVAKALSQKYDAEVSRNAVSGKAHRLSSQPGGLDKPITPYVTPRRQARSVGTDIWPLERRDRLIHLWNADDLSTDDIARELGASVHSVYKKIAGLRRAGIALRVRRGSGGKWTWPWSRDVDKRITGMFHDKRKAARVAAIFRLPVEKVQQRASEWQKRRERVARNKRTHPAPMTGADGQPGLTLMELPDLGACKYGLHLPDIDGRARFCGREAAPGQSWCAEHCDHVFEARARRCAA